VFKKLIHHPAYIFKFAIYILFISFAFIFYFSKALDLQMEGHLKGMFAALLFIYGSYRFIRTYQDFNAELRNEEE
jgi:hypothetical protein